MVIQQRTELQRNRILYFLSIILGGVVIADGIAGYSSASPSMQVVMVAAGVIALAAIVVANIQIFSFPRRSHALLIQRENDTVIATNAVHEGFKLRFLRDVLHEHVFAFSDEDHVQFKPLESDGYFPAMVVRDVRKVLLLRYCTMMFDDVYFVDKTNRWEHHDSSSNSEPTSHKREQPPLRAWKLVP